MIRRLRWKFVAINMAIVTIMLAVIAVFVLSFTRNSLEQESHTLAEQVISQMPNGNGQQLSSTLPYLVVDVVRLFDLPGSSGNFPKMPETDGRGESGSAPKGTYQITAVYSNQGILSSSQSDSIYDSENLTQLVETSLTADASSGVLDGYKLHYLRQQTLTGWRIAFVDLSYISTAIRSLAVNLMLVLGFALAAFFGISLLLAWWAVRPVETSWKQQRQFVADASHELKTPLAVLRANAEMLQAYAPPQDEKALRWLDNIQVSSRQMQKLVEDMLTLARSDSQTQSLVLERLDFSDQVNDCLLLFEPVAFESGRDLMSDVAEGLTVLGDCDRLRQLIAILLDNACKYSPEGGTIRVTLQPDGAKRLRLSVFNTGEPIPQPDLERIFQRFYRRDPARVQGGYGLGLAIARDIARQHGGRLWAESSPDGNTFCLRLERC